MKKLFCILVSILAAGALLVSCEDKNGGEEAELSSDAAIKSVVAKAEHAVRGEDILDISFSSDRKTITLTTRALPMGEDPVDMTKVKITMTYADHATSDLSDGYYDMTKDSNTVTVTAQDGKTTNTVSLVGVVTPPYEVIPDYNTTVTQVWSKTATELGLKCAQSLFGIAVAGDDLFIMDNGVDHNPDTYRIKVYNKATGEYKNDIAAYEGGWWGVPGYMGAIAGDEAGNFGNIRLNEGTSGAGTWVDRYTLEEGSYVYTTQLVTITQELQWFARRLQFLGDIMGNGKIIATNGSTNGGTDLDAKYCVWDVNGGVAGNYSVMPYGSDLTWKSAFVQQAAMDDPTLYISYNTEPNYPNDPSDMWDEVQGAHFAVYDPSSGIPAKEIAGENFRYRILDHQVFKLDGLTFLLTLEQGYSTTTSPMSAKLFNITNDSRYGMKPGDEGYDQFKVFETESVVISNDQRKGNVTAWVDEAAGAAYIVIFYPAGPTTVNPGQLPVETDGSVVVYKVEAEVAG